MSPTDRPKRVWKARSIVLWTALSAVSILVLLTFLTDLPLLIGAIKRFPPWLLVPVGFLSLGNYGLRYLKWHFYLRLLGHHLPPWRNLLVFLSGFALTVTPGKVGEFIKAFIVKERFQVPYTVSTAVLFMERFTDLAAILILAATGISLHFLHWSTGALILTALMASLLVLRNRKFIGYLIGLTGRFKPLERVTSHLTDLYSRGWVLLRLRFFFLSLLISLFAWILEGIGYYIVARGLGADITPHQGVFIYSAAILGGALTLFLGGLGATEGGMVGLGVLFQMERTVSVAVTIIIRTMTLWFGVCIGWAVLFATPGLRSLLKSAGNENGN